MKLEMRMNPTSISTTEDGKMYCEGLVNGTETWSKELGIKRKFVEKVKKGAFTRAIEKAPRIDFLAEHDTTKLLATTDNGSLELFEDSEGLKMRAEIVPTSYGKDMYELMKSGMVRHMSFGFKALKDSWVKRSTGLYERTIEELSLAEVSVVRNPAYAHSGISARNIDIVEDVEIPSEVDEVKEENMEEVVIEKEVVEQEVQATEETVEEVQEVKEVDVEIVEETEEAEEVQETEEATEEPKEEKRAYFMPIYGKSEAVNRCLDIIAQSTELIAFVNEHGSDNAVVPTLQGAIKSVTDYMISLTDVEQKEETVGEVVAEVVEEIVDALVEGRNAEEVETVEVAEATEEKEEIKEETEVVEEVKEEVSENKEDTENTEIDEEKPSIDLSKYRNLIKEEIVL